MHQTAPSLVGKLFGGRYRVHERVGWTSYGQLFAATHELLRAGPLSLCVVPRQLSNSEELHFRAVLRAARRVEHPGIARVLDGGVCEEGWPYIVSEHVDGITLADELRRLNAAGDLLGVEHALTLLTRLAGALQAAHAASVLHLDLRPQSVLLCGDEGCGIKLLGLGLAQALGATSAKRRLDAAERRMSYTSPELRLGSSPDHRADIYSFGVLAFEILSGRPAAIDRERSALAEGRLRRVCTGPSRTRNIPAGLEAVVLRCLEADRARRVASAAELLDALRRVGSAHQRRERGRPGPQTSVVHARPASLPRESTPDTLQGLGTRGSAPVLPGDAVALPSTSNATERTDLLEELVLALRDRGLGEPDAVLDLTAILEAEDEVLRLEGELEQLTGLVAQLEGRARQRVTRLRRALLALDHEREQLQRHPSQARTLPSIDRLQIEQLERRAQQVARFLAHVTERTRMQVAALQRQVGSRQLRLLRRAGYAAELREKLVTSLRTIKPRPLVGDDPELAERFAVAGI
jgi:serine/threonine protein kinase